MKCFALLTSILEKQEEAFPNSYDMIQFCMMLVYMTDIRGGEHTVLNSLVYPTHNWPGRASCTSMIATHVIHSGETVQVVVPSMCYSRNPSLRNYFTHAFMLCLLQSGQGKCLTSSPVVDFAQDLQPAPPTRNRSALISGPLDFKHISPYGTCT